MPLQLLNRSLLLISFFSLLSDLVTFLTFSIMQKSFVQS